MPSSATSPRVRRRAYRVVGVVEEGTCTRCQDVGPVWIVTQISVVSFVFYLLDAWCGYCFFEAVSSGARRASAVAA